MARLAGKSDPIPELDGPEYPETIEYLREMLSELHGRSGVGMDGLAPLSYATIAEWSRLKGVPILPIEVEALMLLDSAMLYPGEPEKDDG
jgi:hypothetical protein